MKVILRNASLVFQVPGLSGNTDILFTSDAYGDLPMAQKLMIDAFVCSLMNSGVWSKLKCLYLPFITTATRGKLNVKTTIDNDTVTIDTWGGSKYALQDNVGVVVEASPALNAKIMTLSSPASLCLFGTSSEGNVGTLYHDNSNRLSVVSSGVKIDNNGVTKTKSLISNTTGYCGAASITSTEINMVNGDDIFHSAEESVISGIYDFYIGYNHTSSASSQAIIKYFGIADGLTQTEFTALVAAIKNFQSILA